MDVSNMKKPGLEDVQGRPDPRGIALDRVGVKDVDMPLTVVQKDGHQQVVAARVTMSVGLQAEVKGTHMSRFIIQLSEWSRSKAITLNLREFLEELTERLDAPSAQIGIAFRYFMEKAAPVSAGLSAPMGYDCTLSGRLDNGVCTIIMGVDVPMSTLCPCSKAISDFGAHNQRAVAKTRVVMDTEHEHSVVWIEDIVAGMDEAASCPVYPLLKRADEKWVTERQYTNAKFVEDVIRDATLFFRGHEGVTGFSLEVEALESIHAHNAWAAHAENFPCV
jgi:GTP cyclohydrolase I